MVNGARGEQPKKQQQKKLSMRKAPRKPLTARALDAMRTKAYKLFCYIMRAWRNLKKLTKILKALDTGRINKSVVIRARNNMDLKLAAIAPQTTEEEFFGESAEDVEGSLTAARRDIIAKLGCHTAGLDWRVREKECLTDDKGGCPADAGCDGCDRCFR